MRSLIRAGKTDLTQINKPVKLRQRSAFTVRLMLMEGRWTPPYTTEASNGRDPSRNLQNEAPRTLPKVKLRMELSCGIPDIISLRRSD